MSKQNKILITCGAILLSTIVVLLVMMFMKKEEQIIYKVTFDTNGGSVISEQLITEGNKATRPENPIKEGYEFGSWQYNNETFDFNASIKENITLKAEWIKIEVEKEPEKVIVKFTTNGGTKISDQEIIKGEEAVKPENPKRDGYVFKGWYLNNKEYKFDKSVNENIELIAKWEKESQKEENSSSNNSEEKPTVKKYTITFDSKGGSTVSKQTVEEGKLVKKPANPTKKGYTFAGWTLNGEAYNFDKKVTSNTTLTATWKEIVKNNYTVTFDSKGGSAVANQTVEEENKVKKPSNPTREGYTFKNWTLNGKTYNFDSAVKGDITLIATWNQKSYTIKSVKADAYSPDAKLSVYENGRQISVKSIKYSDGTLLCNGSNTTVAVLDIEGETNFIVVLNGGTEVRATLQ